MARMNTKHVLDSELDKVFDFIETKKLSNNYTLIETESHTNILVLYCSNKIWLELCDIL